MNLNFRVAPIQDSSVLYVYSIRDNIQIDPPYQRMSDIWTLDKRQLLIDSIINGFDIPKLYFHEFIPLQLVNGKTFQYSIIDGKQRLQAIWSFIENDFPLPDDFEYLDDEKVKMGGMTYSDIAKKYPLIKIRFDSKTLPIVAVQTEDIELIEEMFSRLNEAVPLSAPEKRNAFGGPLPKIIRDLARARFFTEKLPFTNRRYRHYDIATKFLYFEYENKFVDTKKIHLDAFVKNFKKKKEDDALTLHDSSIKVLKKMSKIFSNKDPLLSSVGTVVLYYFIFKNHSSEKWFGDIDRSIFAKFETIRSQNRKIAEQEIEAADYNLLEYDRLTTSPNDAGAIKFRYDVLLKYIEKELMSSTRE